MTAAAPAPPARELGRWLRTTGLPELLAACSQSAESLPHELVARDLQLLPRPLAALARLLVLHEPVQRAALLDVLPDAVIAALVQAGLATDADGVLRMPAHRLVNHFGALLFVGRQSVDARLYYGNDSLALGRWLAPARGRVLDLCAGVGTQGLLCALTADAVVSVERDAAVAPLYGLNAALNGVEHKAELRIGDFLEPLRGERFDRVCCNPPLLPTPPGVAYPRAGDGGPDGLGFTLPLLQALPELLRDDGACHVVGTLMGDARGPDVSRLDAAARSAGLRLLLIVPCRMRMAPRGRMFEGLAATAAQFGGRNLFSVRRAYREHYSLGLDHLYSFGLFATLAGKRKASLELSRHYERSRSLWGA